MVLAAGEGRRLRPLTELVPKPLCPVANVSLLDRALQRLAAAGITEVAVNACYRADDIVEHLADRPVRVSVEAPPALGTGGGVARLRDWIDGRDVLVCNADGYLADGAAAARSLLSGWDRRRFRLLTVHDEARGDFGTPVRTERFAGMSLMSWRQVCALPAGTSELQVPWRRAEAAGELDLVDFAGVFVDCGTPRDYLAANLHASGGTSVVGAGAEVAGRLVRSVVWPGATVTAGETLTDTIRAVTPTGRPLTVHAIR
ncbi:mannose-1-phosphate guanylyltransferase [Actinocatenispora thailandica]|uniref:Mannose-1-phosphate guanylyltransferase n=1 Tax=Actinocatenispora thailandica TaxID=227318 RepID=A0A7R7DS27_9ACTN|nr:mannose-1-phosphate guanylyltransferase [Actinocatenispora thailandica]